MQIVVDGLMTNYSKQGDSDKTVLLLHGWGDSSNTFGQLTKSLSNSYTLVCLDLPGFGQTQPPKDVWGLGDYSQFIRAFLKKTGVESLYAIIGHSNGGALAIKGLSTGDLNAKKLILLSASGIRDKKSLKRHGIKIIAKTGKVATFWMPKAWRSNFRLKLYGVVGSDMLVAPHLQETFKKTVREDVQADAKNISVQTLLIYGKQDKATPIEFGKIYNDLIKDSKLEIVEDAAHFVHHDATDKVIESVRKFLK